MPTSAKYGLTSIRYSTSILGPWSSHWGDTCCCSFLRQEGNGITLQPMEGGALSRSCTTHSLNKIRTKVRPPPSAVGTYHSIIVIYCVYIDINIYTYYVISYLICIHIYIYIHNSIYMYSIQWMGNMDETQRSCHRFPRVPMARGLDFGSDLGSFWIVEWPWRKLWQLWC